VAVGRANGKVSEIFRLMMTILMMMMMMMMITTILLEAWLLAGT